MECNDGQANWEIDKFQIRTLGEKTWKSTMKAALEQVWKSRVNNKEVEGIKKIYKGEKKSIKQKVAILVKLIKLIISIGLIKKKENEQISRKTPLIKLKYKEIKDLNWFISVWEIKFLE